MRASQRHVHAYVLRGFTLLEVLAVIVVLTIVTALGLAGLSSSSSAAELMKVKGGCRNLDAQARLVARTCGASVVIKFDAVSNQLELLQGDNSDHLAAMSVPEGLSVRFDINGVTTDHIIFDRLGRSSDYRVVIASGNRQSRLDIAGLTGVATAREVEAKP